LQEWDDSADHESEILIQARNLKKVYGNGIAAVNDNTFFVRKKEVFGLLGPNGAGKSSMFSVQTLDLKRTSGDVKCMHTDIDQLDVAGQGL